jgi:iron complex transport system permease protein
MTDSKPISTDGFSASAMSGDSGHRVQSRSLGWKVYLVLSVFLICVLLALTLGAFDVGVLSLLSGEASSVQEKVLINIRLPRVLLAALVGASLALSGAALQGLFRNPLADPGLIGVSSGAALGAIFMIVLGGFVNMPESIAPYSVSIAAIFGAAAVTGLLFAIANGGRRLAIVTVLLVGIAINALAGVGIGFFQYISDDSQLRTLTFWMMGSLGRADWTSLVPGSVLMLIGFCLLIQTHRSLDLLQLGEPEAEFMGVDVAYLKKKIVFASAVGVGAAVSLAGMIGFIGLVVPHLVRFLFGVTHRTLMYGSAVVGASLLMLADTVARIAIPPAEIPVSLITSAIGAPFFLWLIVRDRGLWR